MQRKDDMKSGDPVRIKRSGAVVIYMGLVDGLYHFYDAKCGICELLKSKFNLKDKVEMLNGNG